jgi:hypothetical protein
MKKAIQRLFKANAAFVDDCPQELGPPATAAAIAKLGPIPPSLRVLRYPNLRAGRLRLRRR